MTSGFFTASPVNTPSLVASAQTQPSSPNPYMGGYFSHSPNPNPTASSSSSSPPSLSMEQEREYQQEYDPVTGRAKFNTRKASDQCKNMTGYISFVNIQGLENPPEWDLDGPSDEDDQDAAARKAKEERKGWGLSGLVQGGLGLRKLWAFGNASGATTQEASRVNSPVPTAAPA